jgi:hypothetical protein
MTIDLLAGSDALDAYSRVVVEVAERLTRPWRASGWLQRDGREGPSPGLGQAS